MVQDKRRRRKKIRIEDNSSSSDSDSSVDSVQVEDNVEDSDEQMDSEPEAEPFSENARLMAHKTPALDQEFNQYFLKLVTSEFGEDLEMLRKAPDFSDSSLELLINGLKQGANIFDPNQQKMLLK